MNKKYTMIGLIVLVLVGLGLYMRMNRGEMGVMKKSGGSDMISGTLADLAGKGVPLKCTYTHTAPNVQSKGTVYLSGDKLKGDFEGTYDGKTVVSHMIRADKTSYVWTDAEKKGVKMVIDAADEQSMKESAMQMQKDNPGLVDLDSQSMDYACMPWVPSASEFVPPTDIEFTDMSAMMEQMQKLMPTVSQSTKDSMKQSQCDVCAQLPAGESQDQCKQAMGCK